MSSSHVVKVKVHNLTNRENGRVMEHTRIDDIFIVIDQGRHVLR